MIKSIKPPKLLDQLAAAIRLRNYSYRTEQAYTMWVRQYIRFHNLKHSREMAEDELTQFLNYLALQRNVSPNTQHQVLNAINFLYKNVLNQPPDQLKGIAKPKSHRDCQ